MKIIKKGENWCAPTFEDVMAECDRCGSKLSIDSDDVREGHNGTFFECPVCYKHVRLSYEVNERYWNWKVYRDNKNRDSELKEQYREWLMD